MSEPQERWRPVIGWEGMYEVSNTGFVRSVARWVAARGGRRLSEGKVLSPYVQEDTGYHRVCLSDHKNGREEHANVHRLVALAFVPGTGAVVRHLDGNGSNNDASNLAWGSHADNEADKERHGRVPRGETHGMSVLNADLVRNIRELHQRGFSQLKIAAALNLNRGVIGNVVRGESWTHIV